MKIFYFPIVFVLFVISYNDLKNSSDIKVSNSNVNINDIMQFFGIIDYKNDLKNLLFYNNDSVPVRCISVTQEELQNSRIVNNKKFSVLVLDNPAESSVELFYKQNGKKVDRMIEDKYYPDSITLNQLNDTLLVCQYYWKYQ